MQDDSDDESIASSTSTMTAMSDRLKAEEQKIKSLQKIINQLTLEKLAVSEHGKHLEAKLNIQNGVIDMLKKEISAADDRRNYEVLEEREEAKKAFEEVWSDYKTVLFKLEEIEKENDFFTQAMANATEKLMKANKRITEDGEMHQKQVEDLEKYWIGKINEMNSYYKEKLELAKKALDSSIKRQKKALKDIEWKDKSSFKTNNIKLHF